LLVTKFVHLCVPDIGSVLFPDRCDNCLLHDIRYDVLLWKALSKALLELRADMVSQAQSDVLANAEQAAAEVNVQRLVDKRTQELQVVCILIL